MKFSSKEDIEAPIGAVFAMLSEFEAYERSAIRRGIEVQRADPALAPAAGLIWETRFTLRGKPREMRLLLASYDSPKLMRFETVSMGLDGALDLELVALSPRRTRLSVVLDLSPKSLAARLLIQSLKLAKKNLNRRFKLKVADHAKNMEDRHRRSV